jgi:hypothetical protein
MVMVIIYSEVATGRRKGEGRASRRNLRDRPVADPQIFAIVCIVIRDGRTAVPRLHWRAPILAVGLSLLPATLPAQAPQLTVHDVRTFPVPQLARALLGERLGSRVIEAVRHDYGSTEPTPRSVDFYTQPEPPWPRMNRICRTDVITIEYDWSNFAESDDSSPVRIAHIEATSRYLAFPEPSGEPGLPEYDRASEAACAHFRTALDAFRAPNAGDAQWLASLEAEWRLPRNGSRFTFTCEDFADASCGRARRALTELRLNRAADVRNVDCPANRTRPRDSVNFCYRLSFDYPGTDDYPNIDDPEWILTVVGGMRDGMAPVEIRLLHLEHVRQPMAIP